MSLIDEINAGTPRQTVITFPDGDHEDIVSGFKSGSIELEEILCDGESLLFGGCASNMFGCCLISDDILGKKIKVYQKIGEYTQDIFTGYIDSLTETNERTYHKLIAYDAIKRHGADNVAEWYNSLWESKSEYTLKEFRDSFFAHIGVEQVDVELVNDNMAITKTISGESIPAINIMKAICEINGVFGNVNRQGIFDYVNLGESSKGYIYRSGDSAFESYNCNPITRVRVIEDEDDVGAVVGQDGNTYTVCGNILTLGTGTEERASIADKLLTKIYEMTYRPADIVGVISDPTIQLGDKLTVDVNGEEVTTYVLKNRMYGVQMFSQRIESEGVELYSETDIDVNTEIQRIKSKQLKITKTVEEFKTEVVDGVRDAKSTAKQTADKMEWIVKEVEGEGESSLEITDEAIEATTKKLLITTPDGKTVLIEGGKMLIDEIFAQAITATGSISGAKLIGATGEFEGDIATYGTITLYTGTIMYDEEHPDGYFVKDAGKIVLDATSAQAGPAGAPPVKMLLVIDSHLDTDLSTIIGLTRKNLVRLEAQDSDGTGGTVIQFGLGGTTGTVKTLLTVKPQFTYKDSPGDAYVAEIIPSPHIERLMVDALAVVNAYLENTVMTGKTTLEGATSSGNISINADKLPDWKHYEVKTSLRHIQIAVNGSGYFGVYDRTNGKWIYYSDLSGNHKFLSPVTITSPSWNPLIVERTDSDGNVAIRFVNTEGTLGYITMIDKDKGARYIPGSNTNKSYKIIDSSDLGYKSSGNKTVSVSADTATNLASITLTPGLWLVTGGARYTPTSSGTIISKSELSVNTTSATITTIPTQYIKSVGTSSSEVAGLNLTTVVRVEEETTVYLVGRVKISGSSSATTALSKIFAFRQPEL